jgi:hypothetical protein
MNMAFAHVLLMVPALFGGQFQSLDHVAPRTILPVGSSTADDKNDGFICATLCPGTFCPSGCSDDGQEPKPGDIRTQQQSNERDGPSSYDATRGPKSTGDDK